MALQTRDKRALAMLAGAVVLVGAYWLWTTRAVSTVAASSESVASYEQRLYRLRDMAATVSAKQDILKKVSGDLAEREKGLIKADTAQQAQAQLIAMLRQIGATQRIDISSNELGPIAPLGDKYGSVTVSVQFTSGIEGLLTMLASLSAQPELVATRDLRIIAANAKDKTLGVRLTVMGVIPRGLVPKNLVPDTGKKGKAAF